MASLTFDTGALIELENEEQGAWDILQAAIESNDTIYVPLIAYAEWWRGSSWLAEKIRGYVTIESMDVRLAKIAGEAVAATPGAGINDALVVASAARRPDEIVYTQDVGDLPRLAAFFPGSRLRIRRV